MFGLRATGPSPLTWPCSARTVTSNASLSVKRNAGRATVVRSAETFAVEPVCEPAVVMAVVERELAGQQTRNNRTGYEAVGGGAYARFKGCVATRFKRIARRPGPDQDGAPSHIASEQHALRKAQDHSSKLAAAANGRAMFISS